MSRCFPYPPPGYSGNGATYEALIESIKLQKDTDKIKSERKKEKRAKKEKKEKKEKRKEEKSKLQKHPNESQQELQDHHKSLQTSLHFKKTDPSIDQHLERSDLTEEHGQPVDSHKPSYSSDSTQNSNKRKREDPVIPDGSNNVNKPIKIRLLKKKKGPDSIKETSSNSERTDQQNLHFVQDSRLNSSKVSTSTSEFNGERTQLVSSNRKTERKILPLSKIEEPVSLQSKKDDVAVCHSSIQQSIPIPSFTRPSENDIPSSSQIAPPPVPHDVSSSGRKSTNEVKESDKNEKKKEPMTRHEKKLHKKYSKYEKLIGSWVPPVLESLMSTDNGSGDDDWLMGSGKKGSARSAIGDDMEVCREVTWQPCARFLVEGDVYAMPYTVPF